MCLVALVMFPDFTVSYILNVFVQINAFRNSGGNYLNIW